MRSGINRMLSFNRFRLSGVWDMKTETQEFELNLAVAWNDGKYTDSQAKLSASAQGLSWANITIQRARLYEIEQREGANKWN